MEPELISTRHVTERIGRLETSVEVLRTDGAETRRLLLRIQEAISRGRETNWGVVLAAVGLAGALYGAAIRPLEQDTHRTQRAAEDLAKAVLVRDMELHALRIDAAKTKAEIQGALMLVEYRLENRR